MRPASVELSVPRLSLGRPPGPYSRRGSATASFRQPYRNFAYPSRAVPSLPPGAAREKSNAGFGGWADRAVVPAGITDRGRGRALGEETRVVRIRRARVRAGGSSAARRKRPSRGGGTIIAAVRAGRKHGPTRVANEAGNASRAA